MTTTKYRVSLAFGRLNDDSLITFAWGVHTHLYADPLYSEPPVTAALASATITAFSDAKVAQAGGGRIATAEKNQRRAELLDMLQNLAYYVQIASAGVLPYLLNSGYEAMSNNRAQAPLARPTLTRIVTGMSGQALVSITPDRNARACEIIVAEIDESGSPGPFRPAVMRTSSQNIPIDDLVPGKFYAYQGRSIGGLTVFSDWSDVLVQRAA